MRIGGISNIFSKNDGKIYVTKSTKDGVQKLLEKMHRQSPCKLNAEKTSWQSDILASVSTGKVKFTDTKALLECPKPYDCSLFVGKKNVLLINSSTGEVIGYKTGLFTSIRGLMYKAETYVNKLLVNFENPNVVKKNSFGVVRLTQKGYERLQQNSK